MKIKSLLFCNSSYFYHRLIIMASGCKWDALPMMHLQRHAKNFQKNWLQSVKGNFAYIFVPRGSSGPYLNKSTSVIICATRFQNKLAEGQRYFSWWIWDIVIFHEVGWTLIFKVYLRFFLVNFNSAIHIDLYFFWLHVLKGVIF